jgi:hypothetical protein
VIIEDINFVPYYFDPNAIIMIRLTGMSTIDDSLEEKAASERLNNRNLQITVYLMFGLSQNLVLSKKQYDELWEKVKNELCD